jgi:hypothetical protein
MAFAVNCRLGVPVPFTLWIVTQTTTLARRGASAIKSAILIRAISRMAANNKCLAERNKSEERGPATKRHDNDFAQIPFRGPMHPVGRNDRGYSDALLLPPTLQRRIELCR